jgi:hypothetical protein
MRGSDWILMIYTFKSSIPTYPLTLESLKLLLNHPSRGKELNSTILICIYSVCEGALNNTFQEIILNSESIKNAARNSDLLVFRELHKLAMTRKKGLDDIKKCYQLIGIDLSHINGWTDLKALSEFRNMIAHGGSFDYEHHMIDTWIPGTNDELEDKPETIKKHWTRDKLITYLIDEKLIRKDFRERVSKPQEFFEIFQDPIVDHFVKKIVNFFDDYLVVINPKITGPSKEGLQKIKNIID